MAQIVKFTINEQGEGLVDLEGFQGKGCAAIQAGFEKALGGEVEHKLKPEYNKPELKIKKGLTI